MIQTFSSELFDKGLARWNEGANGPPLVFRSTQSPLFSQTKPKFSRETVNGNITLKTHAESAALKSVAEDAIDTLNGIVRYCNTFTPKNCVDNSAPGAMIVLKFNGGFPPGIEHSSLIRDSFQGNTYGGHTKVGDFQDDMLEDFENLAARYVGAYKLVFKKQE